MSVVEKRPNKTGVLGQSLGYNENKMGDTTQPCRTPAEILIDDDTDEERFVLIHNRGNSSCAFNE